MSRAGRMLCVFVFAAAILVSGRRCTAAVSALNIIPVPREVRRTPDQPLGESALVMPGGAPEKFQIAVSEINLRLADLGAQPLPVLAAGTGAESGFRGRRIVLSVRTAADREVPDRGEGYLIDSTASDRVRLVGADEQGLLWAAVTFRRMLVKEGGGAVVVLGARIRDWPSFALRSVGRWTALRREPTLWTLGQKIKKGGPGLEKTIADFLAVNKAIVDEFFRLKLNHLLGGQPPAESIEELAKQLGGAEKADLYCRTVKAVSDYAWARGMVFQETQKSNVGTSPRDDKDPVITRCVRHGSHKQYFCWSLDEHNRRRAEDIAKLYARTGTRMSYVHAFDGGGYENPGGWNGRCEACRERFGDDHGAADAHVFTIWYEALRKYAPELTYFSFVQYPYQAHILTRPASGPYGETLRYWRTLNERLPRDPNLGVCVRENTPENIRLFYEVFNRTQVLVYWMPNNNGGDQRWNALFSGRLANARTFLRRDGRPSWIMCPPGCGPAGLPACAQYIWNPDTPGAFDYPGSLDVDRDGAEPAVFFDEWLPKFVGEWYGEPVAYELADMFKGCISPSYALQPDVIAGSMRGDVTNGAARMAQQYGAVKKGVQGLERVWAWLEAGEQDLFGEGRARYFHRLCQQGARTLAYASYRLATLELEEGVRAGTPTPDLIAGLTAAVARVQADNATAARMEARLKGKDMSPMSHLNRWHSGAQNRLYNDPDHDAHVRKLEELLSMLRGQVVELREARGNEGSMRWLMKDGDGLTFGKKGGTEQALVDYPTQGGSAKAVQADRLYTPYQHGLRLSFPPVDVSGYREKGGRLRFYVNAGLGGGHDFTFWLNSRGTAGQQMKEPEQDKGLLFGHLRDYVTVDGLEATWQLVDVPLAKILKPGHTELCGFSMNYTLKTLSGPFWLDSMYVCLAADPVPVKVPVQERSVRPATRAGVEPVLVRTRKFVGGEGTESQITLSLRLTGDGRLTDARIVLCFRNERGQPFFTHEVVSARSLRTPQWFEPLTLDLGRECAKATLDIALSSREVNETSSVEAVWD